jgi:GT2 family glycosyltransferase
MGDVDFGRNPGLGTLGDGVAHLASKSERSVTPPSIAVCIPTYRRPEFLQGVLESLATADTAGFTTHVIVVDNDAAGSARATTERFGAAFPSLIFEIQPERGIAAARNRLVAAARRVNAEYVAFVDDDEWVEPAWLQHLARAARVHQAGAVAGPVVPDYDDGVPGWVVAGGFFDERPRRRTGDLVRVLGMGNVLIERSWLDRLDGPFDQRLALAGGEDPDLWARLFQLGLRMIWCDEAVVHERIPASRATARWILQRQVNYGITGSRLVRRFEPSPARFAVRAARTFARIGQGLLLLPPSLFRGRSATVRALQYCARGAGGVVGLAGVRSQEYRHIHGR